MHLVETSEDVTWDGTATNPPASLAGIQTWSSFVTAHPEWRGTCRPGIATASAGGLEGMAHDDGCGHRDEDGASLTDCDSDASMPRKLKRQCAPASASGSIVSSSDGDGVRVCEPTVFFETVCPGSLRQRSQARAPCFMQAPNVLVHYLCCLHYKGCAPPPGIPTMIDLTKLRLRHSCVEALWELIDRGIGGYAVSLLGQLCSIGQPFAVTTLSEHSLSVKEGEIIANLGQYGPALVATMNIKGEEIAQDPVYDPAVCHHAGVEDRLPATKLLHHAVLIVGHRPRPGGSVEFLVQNWWEDKQFFTCDLAFLVGREATLVWVTTPVSSARVLGADEMVSACFAHSAPSGTAEPGVRTRA